MFYVIQEDVFQEEGYTALTETLERLGLDWEVVKVLPFVEGFEYQTDREDVFVFGSLKMVRLAQACGWKPGVVLGRNHNFLAYRNKYEENLLNFDSKVYRFEEDFPWSQPQYFIRPVGDGKEFNGGVFDVASWGEFKERTRTSGHATSLTGVTLIQVAYPKRIQKEFRFWVVGGKVVTGSQYKLGRRTVYDAEVDPGARRFAQRMVNLFQLADAFVIDVCLSDDRWRIVECGCINCAGFYRADMQRLLMALEEHYG